MKMRRLYIGFTDEQLLFIRLRSHGSNAAFVRRLVEAELQKDGPACITGKGEMQAYFRDCAAKRQAAKGAKRDVRREKKRIDMQHRRATVALNERNTQ